MMRHLYHEHVTPPDGNERPEISVVYTPNEYHRTARMPFGVFDPLYPEILCEATADRRLASRITIEFENEGYRTLPNHPYLLPEGSVEVRSQVWLFFKYLKQRFEEYIDKLDTLPEELVDRKARSYTRVWDMLLDTNLRHSETDRIRSYIHMFRLASNERDDDFERANKVYAAVRSFLERNTSLIDEYRQDPCRTSSLAIEVRKDLVWKYDKKGNIIPGPTGAKTDVIEEISETLSKAIRKYLREDRSELGLA